MWKKALLIFLSLFLTTGCGTKHQKNLVVKTEASDPYSWDFGSVRKDIILKHSFILKNDSNKTLNIKNVSTSCGCTVSKVNKKVLLPGDSTNIDVEFKTKGYKGPVQQYVYVETDNIDASASLSINGEPSRTIDNPILRFIIKAEVTK